MLLLLLIAFAFADICTYELALNSTARGGNGGGAGGNGAACFSGSDCMPPLVCTRRRYPLRAENDSVGVCFLPDPVERAAFGVRRALGVDSERAEYCFDPLTTPCSALPRSLLRCELDCACTFGASLGGAACHVRADALASGVDCVGARAFTLAADMRDTCRFCFQLPPEAVTCDAPLEVDIDDDDDNEYYINRCVATAGAADSYVARCAARERVVCLGARQFERRRRCTHTDADDGGRARTQRTAAVLSVFLGGFGADRFYLGDVGGGIGKLLTLGGFGLLSLVDAVLTLSGYLHLANGALFAPDEPLALRVAAQDDGEL